jgi:membrane protease subunit HflC
VLVTLVIANSTLFTLYQTDQALLVRLGEPFRVVTEPGLNFKIPFLDSVIDIDKRILDLENPSQEVIASDQKRLVVDAFARDRVNDALKFYQTIGAIEGPMRGCRLCSTRRCAASLARQLRQISCATNARS